MRLVWEISEDDTSRIQAFLARHKDNAFVKNRLQKNVAGPRPQFSRELFWRQMVACLLTSQQKSGPESPVSRLIHTEPFPVSYLDTLSHGQPAVFVRERLASFGGIRRYDVIAEECAFNLRLLEERFWPTVASMWAKLAEADDAQLERKAARLIDHELKGFGPKQSRNLLQGLGLTRYEIAIDSRVGKRLVELGFPLPVSTKMLADATTYELILDGIQELCRKSGVVPCVLDAAMFASFDGDGWEDIQTIW